MTNSGRLINIIFVAVFITVILGAIQRYYFIKEYMFTIEVPCDTASEHCFHRDCSTDDCPPNNLEDYRVFEMRAKRYDACSADDCANYCKSNNGCIETVCDPSTDTCSGVK